jgi:hypothetical protein
MAHSRTDDFVVFELGEKFFGKYSSMSERKQIVPIAVF